MLPEILKYAGKGLHNLGEGLQHSSAYNAVAGAITPAAISGFASAHPFVAGALTSQLAFHGGRAGYLAYKAVQKRYAKQGGVSRAVTKKLRYGKKQASELYKASGLDMPINALGRGLLRIGEKGSNKLGAAVERLPSLPNLSGILTGTGHLAARGTRSLFLASRAIGARLTKRYNPTNYPSHFAKR